MATLVLTVLGEDRPGLVSELSAPISAHGASWERSRLAQLAGKVAGIVMVSVPDERYDALAADLAAVRGTGIKLTLERSDQPAPQESRGLVLELLGNDRPGIVTEISSALAGLGVSIEELTTDIREAPHAGGVLFEARAVLDAPHAAEPDRLRAVLEALADELMVDVMLSEEGVPLG